MCGIAGYINKDFNEVDKDFVQAGFETLKNRGPDENGYYADNKVCILNTRLSIIDIKNGQQPFSNHSKDISVVQNGEIYNFVEVKNKLINEHCISFTTNSDTEVILKAYEVFGDACFELFNGMFAIAIYDKKKNCVLLARDRLGVKPLYICELKDRILFSSEIKTFVKLKDFDKSINNQAILNYMKFNYVPIPETIFQSVRHLEPGKILKFNLEDMSMRLKDYWEIEDKIEEPANEIDVIENMEDILNNAIEIRLRSDVEIGAFLSGGLDSSLVCAMAKKNFNISLNTFSIGFPEKRFDESGWAKEVAKLYGLKININVLEPDIINFWEETTWLNDQPHGDISFIPTYLLSKFASRDYKVVFTGDGGDEFCGGYKKYFELDKSHSLNEYFDNISLIKDDNDFNNLFSDQFLQLVDIKKPVQIFNECLDKVSKKDDINKILFFDVQHLLPGNNLVKPDKMAMACGLETRSPMLDYRFLEYMQSVPGNMKIRNNDTKYILKKLALKYLPEDIVYRKKQMFTVPVGEWFKSSLKEYISLLLQSDKFKKRGIYNQDYIDQMLEKHTNNISDYTRELRAIANLEIWFQKYID